MYYLSKSDFKLSLNCETKLFYKKKGYPNSNSENKYMQFLAEGGYMVGKLATMLYPDGVEINTGNNHYSAIEQTEKLIAENENITIFEAAILSNNKLIRIDILEKIGNQLNLIEVKSASFNSSPFDGLNEKSLKKIERNNHFYDVAFQYYVTKEKYPHFKLKPFLLMPDQNKRTKIDGLNQLFSINEIAQTPGSNFYSYEVSVNQNKINDILNEDILTLIDASEQVENLQKNIQIKISNLLPSIENGLTKIITPLSTKCFSCEFSKTDENFTLSGFDECWANIPKSKNHIKDLSSIGSLHHSINPLINKGIVDYEEIIKNYPDVFDENKAKGKRILFQIKSKKENREILLDEGKLELQNWKYPLYFIDFETAMHALPYHKNMRPYENAIFQWSCHVIRKEGAEPEHYEWISLDNELPNFKFAESLMELIGTNGTPLMWSFYENTKLNDIYNQMEVYDYKNDRLKKWLYNIVKIKNSKDGRLVDMNDFALKYYIHPLMKGKTSIKVTLPAVLSSVKSPRIIKWLKEFDNQFSLYGNDGKDIIDPYKLLPTFQIENTDVSLHDGTGAMTAYADSLFGLSKGNKEKKEAYEIALKRYCKLDTLAMVIIWEHWFNC